MPGRTKQIKEQMAQTEDPLVRMQLGALLNDRRQRRGGILRRAEDSLDSLLGPAIERWPAGVPSVLFLLLLAIAVFIIVVILECTAVH